MERKQIQFTARQAAAVRRAARGRNVSEAAIVRDAVDQWLSDPPSDRHERVERALAVIGRFHSGTRTTARDHDDALADAFRP